MTTADVSLPGRLVAFVEALRSKGIPAGTSETVDAAAVAEVLGLDDRALLREGLASALVRRGGQREIFDQAFDIFFPAAVGSPQSARQEPGADQGEKIGVDELRERLATALAESDDGALEQLARLAVDRLGRIAGADDRGWSSFQTLSRLRPATMLTRALELRAGAGGGGGGGPATGQGGAQEFTDRLERDEVRRAIDGFTALIEAEARRRSAELRGPEEVFRDWVRPGGEQAEFLTANRRQREQMRIAVRPLARKLATRLSAKRRRRRRGRIDIRRTLRRSMSTGGVPMHPVYAKPRPTRPDLVLLCDVSGSVAGFSQFTMLLVQALSDQFSSVRVFAFVSAMADVTDIVRQSDGDLAARILQEARVSKWDNSSDYGEALGDFAADHLETVGPRTAVLVLGDGRTNFGDPNYGALRLIAQRSRRTFWLNPERETRWGSGDSAATGYGEIVEMHECCTVEQLSRFITRLLPV